MVGMNNKNNSKDKSSLFQKIHKIINSATVFALLFPSISSIGLVQAAEEETEDPPVEEVVPQSESETEDINIDPEVEDNDLDSKTEDKNSDTETALPETLPEEDEFNTPPSEKNTVESEQQIETPEDTTEEDHSDAIVSEQSEPKQDLPDPTEVRVLIHVRTPSNMENYVNTLEDFSTYPLTLTNQVTGETFTTSVRPSDNNASNYFTLEANVHAYVRGNAPENDYDITLPQELIDLGYSLTRNHRVRSNFGIVGSTNLSYNAPQVDEVIGTLRKNTVGYSHIEGRDLQILLESLDGKRSYSLGNRDISIPAGEYNLSIGNAPTDSRPNVVYRKGTLVNIPETEIPVNKSGNDYVGKITLDFTSNSQIHVLRIIEADLDVSHTVTINPNGGTIDPEYENSEVEEDKTYELPSRYKSNLERPGYTLSGYTVEGTLLDADGNEVTEIPIFGREYIPESDVTLTAIWEETVGGFRTLIYDDAPGTQTERYTVTLIAEDGTEYLLSSNQYGPDHRTWKVEDIPNGTYTLVVDGFNILEGEKFGQPDTTSEFVVNDDGTATVDLEFVDNNSTTFIRYRIYGEPVPEVETYPLSVEVRDLDNKRTGDVDITVTNENDEVFTGSYNDYLQWFTDEELPEGLYTITLDTPNGTYAEINDTVASQRAVATDEENVFTIEVNEENQGNLSAVFAAFRLIEVEATYQLGVEVRDLDNKRTGDVDITVTNEDDEVFTGSYNDYLQWFTDEELPEGLYTITLTTPEVTVAEINDTVASQRAVATDEENVFAIEVNEENQGSLSAVFAAFRLVEVPPVEVTTYQLGVEVRDLDDKRTDEVDVVVTNQDGEVFNGSYNQYKQWLTDEELPEGLYTITLTTPEGTVAEINDATDQYAVATDEENVFTILLNDENLGYGSSIYGAFRLVKVDDDTEEPEEPTDPSEPEEPEKPEDSETPDDKDKDDSEKLPQTGMILPSIGLGIASILGGLGLSTINKKRKEEDKQ